MSYYVDPTVGGSSPYSAPHPAMAVSDDLFLASFPSQPSLYAFLLAPGDTRKPEIQLWTSQRSSVMRLSTLYVNIKWKSMNPGVIEGFSF